MANGKKNGNQKRQPGWAPLRDNRRDREHAEVIPRTPQSASSTYKLAYTDTEFMSRDELRPVRLQLELLKAAMLLDEYGIHSTVVLFGGARIPAPGKPALSAINEKQKQSLEGASHFYEEARKFARLCAAHSGGFEHKEYVVVTGGGPGIMEAGNRGASEMGAPTIGLNIVLPHEQAPNAYVTPDLSFNFHYFAIRKMHFMMRAKAVAVFPGGFGTLDELFETLTLVQTRRMEKIPVILFGEAFWRSIVNFEALADFGTIAPDDLKLLHFAETADEAWAVVADHYQHAAPANGL